MSTRPQLAAGAVVLLIWLVLLNLPDQTAVRVKVWIGGCFLPLFGLVGSAQGLTSEAMRLATPREELARQIQQVAGENATLRLELDRLAGLEEENRRLRQLVGWRHASPWKSRLCHVLARDTANWWRTLRIEGGSRDGLRPGLPVVSTEGLVGRLDHVAATWSDVVLVGDPKCRVSVVVRETGENGVLSVLSHGVLDHRLVDLTHLPRHIALRPGQTVHTSGMGGVFPAGIPVGSIVDARSVSYGLYSEARVKLAADTSRLREILVLLP